MKNASIEQTGCGCNFGAHTGVCTSFSGRGSHADYTMLCVVVILLLSVPHAAINVRKGHRAAKCNGIQDCSTCARTAHGGTTCQWCPMDMECHAASDRIFTPCNASQVVVKPDHCVAPAPAPGNATYDPSRAAAMLHFATASYCKTTSIDAWSCKPCHAAMVAAGGAFNATAFTDDDTQGQAFVGAGAGGRLGRIIVVAFRGSSNLRNWISDLSIRHISTYKRCDGCEVHAGFYKAWLGLQRDVVSEVMRLLELQPVSRLYVVGHSLGAALAVLAAADFSHAYALNVSAVYTFGEPRVGNEAFKEFYESASQEQITWRVVHHRDPVPKLPLSSWGFKHHAREVFYNSNSSHFKVCDGTGHDLTCSDSLRFSDNLADHISYLGLVQGAAACK